MMKSLYTSHVIFNSKFPIQIVLNFCLIIIFGQWPSSGFHEIYFADFGKGFGPTKSYCYFSTLESFALNQINCIQMEERYDYF